MADAVHLRPLPAWQSCRCISKHIGSNSSANFVIQIKFHGNFPFERKLLRQFNVRSSYFFAKSLHRCWHKPCWLSKLKIWSGCEKWKKARTAKCYANDCFELHLLTCEWGKSSFCMSLDLIVLRGSLFPLCIRSKGFQTKLSRVLCTLLLWCSNTRNSESH